MAGAHLRQFLAGLGLFRRNKGGPSRRSGHAAEIGAWGEREAERWLRSGGFTVIDRNVATASGEADLVCRAPDGKTIVIVEVKARVVSQEAGVFRPERAVDRQKIRRLGSVARLLRAANGWKDRPVRVDVVAIERIDEEKGQRVVTRHHEGIVRIAPERRRS